jgi:hypothetical protein
MEEEEEETDDDVEPVEELVDEERDVEMAGTSCMAFLVRDSFF